MDKLKEKPFALIGVNCWHDDPAKLKKVMIREKLNWRTFAAKGYIAEQWNNPGTPTFYVIDHTGAIRRKWVGSPGEKSIDAALENLIQEVEETSVPK